jgi:hypothetical protein
MTMSSNNPLVFAVATAVVTALLSAAVPAAAPRVQDGATRTVLTRRSTIRPRTVVANPAGSPAIRKVYVTTSTEFVAPEEIERKLADRSEFDALGLEITRDPADADFVVEVRRIALSHFRYAVVDARTRTTLRRGEVTSLFGTASGRVAQRVLEAIGG